MSTTQLVSTAVLIAALIGPVLSPAQSSAGPASAVAPAPRRRAGARFHQQSSPG